MTVGHTGNHHAQFDSLGVTGDEVEQAVALGHVVLGWPEEGQLEEVIHRPDGIEAGSLGALCDRGHRLSDGRWATRPGELLQIEADIHRNRSLAASMIRWRPCEAPSLGAP